MSKRCPDRYTRDHRNCFRCDKEWLAERGFEDSVRVVGLERSLAAQKALKEEGIIR